MTSSDITAIAIGVLALVTLMWKSVSALFSRKFKTPADIREEKKLDDAANSAALARLEALLQASDKRHADEIAALRAEHEKQKKDWNEKFKEMGERVNDVEAQNTDLIRFSYACIAIIRDNDLVDLLPKERPKGIYI